MHLPGKIAVLLSGFVALLPQAQGAAPASYPIRVEQVARAVLAAHPELAGDAIELPGALAARETAPVLGAGPVERWSQGTATAHIRLRCQSESVCLPFYVSVRTSAPLTGAPGQPAQNEKTAPEPALRAGERVSMVIDSGRLHLRVPVICLSGGAVGSLIRVSGPARTKVFEAAVVDGSTVRGSL